MGGYQCDDVTSCDVKYGRPSSTKNCHRLRHEGIKQGDIVETPQKVYRDKGTVPDYRISVVRYI